jgi:hypothetical protein
MAFWLPLNTYQLPDGFPEAVGIPLYIGRLSGIFFGTETEEEELPMPTCSRQLRDEQHPLR